MTKPRLPRRRMPPPERTFSDRKKKASKDACRGPNYITRLLGQVKENKEREKF